MKTTGKLNPALHAIHVLAFCLLYILLPLFMVQYPQDWQGDLQSAGINEFEISLLSWFAGIIFLNQPLNLARLSILLFLFTLISPNRKKFMIVTSAIAFFTWFFGLYLHSEIVPGIMASNDQDFFFSLLYHISIILLLQVIPAIVVSKLMHKIKERKEKECESGISLLECPSCGTIYNSNPRLCVRCLEPIDQ
ncbi:hypothetical protein GF325_07590 [Candidatus Bathyarchaeota archaeon]|nr:hypothetical protein [Candidatus Bathyarchaeota archaeon]